MGMVGTANWAAGHAHGPQGYQNPRLESENRDPLMTPYQDLRFLITKIVRHPLSPRAQRLWEE